MTTTITPEQTGPLTEQDMQRFVAALNSSASASPETNPEPEVHDSASDAGLGIFEGQDPLTERIAEAISQNPHPRRAQHRKTLFNSLASGITVSELQSNYNNSNLPRTQHEVSRLASVKRFFARVLGGAGLNEQASVRSTFRDVLATEPAASTHNENTTEALQPISLAVAQETEAPITDSAKPSPMKPSYNAKPLATEVRSGNSTLLMGKYEAIDQVVREDGSTHFYGVIVDKNGKRRKDYIHYQKVLDWYGKRAPTEAELLRNSSPAVPLATAPTEIANPSQAANAEWYNEPLTGKKLAAAILAGAVLLSAASAGMYNQYEAGKKQEASVARQMANVPAIHITMDDPGSNSAPNKDSNTSQKAADPVKPKAAGFYTPKAATTPYVGKHRLVTEQVIVPKGGSYWQAESEKNPGATSIEIKKLTDLALAEARLTPYQAKHGGVQPGQSIEVFRIAG